MDLSIVILNYNARNYLPDCIKSIKDSDLSGISYEVIVVDNASSDGSQEIIKEIEKKTKNMTSVLSKENLGFTKGNNLGAKKTQGKYVLFLNPDTVLSKDALKKVFNFMEENPNTGVATAKLSLESGELDSASHRGFPTPWNSIFQFTGLRGLFPYSRIFAGYSKGWLLKDKNPHEVDAISGAFFFVRRKVAEKVGWWDEDYFMYGEDIDFSYRIKEGGYKVMFLPNVKVLHYGGVSAGIRKHIRKKSTATKETRLRSARASTQAMRIFYKKHYTGKYPSFLTSLVLASIGLLEQIRIWRIKLS